MRHLSRPVVIQVRKGNLVLSPYRMAYNNLANIIELIPILIKVTEIPIKWLKLGSTWYGNVECLGGEEGLEVEQVVVVFVDDVR